MYRFVGEGVLPISGLPMEADDDEFNAAVEAYEKQFDNAEGSVKASGLYKHIPGKLENVRAREAEAAAPPPPPEAPAAPPEQKEP